MLSTIKNEYQNSSKSTIISNQYTSVFQCATSENPITQLASKQLLSHHIPLAMKLPAIYNSELFHNHPSLGNHNCSTKGHILHQVRHFSSISKTGISEGGKTQQFQLSTNIYDNAKSLFYKRNTPVSHNCRRTFLRPSLDSRRLSSVSLVEIKRFLKQKLVDFKETHACLCLR